MRTDLSHDSLSLIHFILLDLHRCWVLSIFRRGESRSLKGKFDVATRFTSTSDSRRFSPLFDVCFRMKWMEIKLGFSGEREGKSAVG